MVLHLIHLRYWKFYYRRCLCCCSLIIILNLSSLNYYYFLCACLIALGIFFPAFIYRNYDPVPCTCTLIRVFVHRRKLLRAWVTLRDSRESSVSPLSDDRGRSSSAWAFGSRCQSEHVTISVLGTGATGSSILSFLTSTSRCAFVPKRFGPLNS